MLPEAIGWGQALIKPALVEDVVKMKKFASLRDVTAKHENTHDPGRDSSCKREELLGNFSLK